MSVEKLIHVCGFVHCPHPDSLHPIPNPAVFLISYRDIAALSRRVSEEEFGDRALEKHLKDPEWLKTELWEQEQILERVMEAQTVAPLKWGTVFRTQEAVRDVLCEGYTEIRGLLERLDGRQEWTVRALVDRRRFDETIVIHHPEIRQLSVRAGTMPPGSAYLMNEQLKLKSKEISQQIMDGIIQEVWGRVSVHTESSVRTEPLGAGSKDQGSELVFQMAFLVHKEKLPGFSEAILQAARKWHDQGLQIQQIGPFPPYYFCDLQLKEGQHA